MELNSEKDKLADEENFDLVGPLKTEFVFCKQLANTPLLNAAGELAADIETLTRGDLSEDGAKEKNEETSAIGRRIDELSAIIDGILNTGHYSEVEDKYRVLYGFVCALNAKFHFLSQKFFLALRACDDGLLKGHDFGDGGGWLSRFAHFLCWKKLPLPEALPKMTDGDCSQEPSVSRPPPPLSNSRRIPVMTLPALATFYTEFYTRNRPLVIRGLVSQWPAFKKWNFHYLNTTCGHRTVPVELGRLYTDDDWRQTLMSFHQYLRDYVFNSANASTAANGGYLAQHRLADQIPQLLADIIVPDYCAFGVDGDSAEDSTNINMFIGPAGTVSPLHTDPRHNFFCQVAGRKFVRLIDAKWAQKLYLFNDMIRKNTSQVNVEEPDPERFPDFFDVELEDFVVEPGDCLFIPRGYFHHVRALERSISVSIWFGD